MDYDDEAFKKNKSIFFKTVVIELMRLFKLTLLFAVGLSILIFSCLSTFSFGVFFQRIFSVVHLKQSTSNLILNSTEIRHCIVYAFLTLLIFINLGKKKLYLTPIVAMTFGVLMELTQLLIPSRDSNLDDLFWNTIGIAITIVLILLVKFIKLYLKKTDEKKHQI